MPRGGNKGSQEGVSETGDGCPEGAVRGVEKRSQQQGTDGVGLGKDWLKGSMEEYG